MYCGEPLTEEFGLINIDLRFVSAMLYMSADFIFRLDIAGHILELHKHDIQHGDLAERNIPVNKEGKPFIINFDSEPTGTPANVR